MQTGRVRDNANHTHLKVGPFRGAKRNGLPSVNQAGRLVLPLLNASFPLLTPYLVETPIVRDSDVRKGPPQSVKREWPSTVPALQTRRLFQLLKISHLSVHCKGNNARELSPAIGPSFSRKKIEVYRTYEDDSVLPNLRKDSESSGIVPVPLSSEVEIFCLISSPSNHAKQCRCV